MQQNENDTTECERLFSLYADVKDAPLVAGYIRTRPHLIQTLHDAPNRIRQFFGENASCCLKIFHDLDRGSLELFLVITTPLSPVEAITKEHEMLENWWLDAAIAVEADMTVVVEAR